MSFTAEPEMKKLALGLTLALSSNFAMAVADFYSDYSDKGSFQFFSAEGDDFFRHDENTCTFDSVGNANRCTKLNFRPEKVKLRSHTRMNLSNLKGTLYEIFGHNNDDHSVYDRKLPYRLFVFAQGTHPYPARLLMLDEAGKVSASSALYSKARLE